MPRKSSDLVGAAEMYIGTIHGFCLDLLKTEAPEFSKFEVLNEVQQALFVNRYSNQSGLTNTRTLQGQPLRRFVDSAVYIKTLSILREDPPTDLEALKGNSALAGLNVYRALLTNKSYFDYSSIIEEAVRALQSNVSVRLGLASRVKAVIVDEYQDVNPIQEKMR